MPADSSSPDPSGLESATRPQTSDGRQYHLGVAAGDVAPNVVLVGDPARARRIGEQFTEVRTFENREFVTITGTWNDLPLTVIATGIGCDNTEIAMVELAQVLDPDAILIRAGTCGGLQPDIELGDLIVTWGAVRLESTSTSFVPSGYPAVAHPDVCHALLQAASDRSRTTHFGMTATAPGFYAAQGRAVPPFSTRFPNRVEELETIGVKNLEMEASTLLTLASLAGYRAGCICVAFAERQRDVFVSTSQKVEFENRCVESALLAIRTLRSS